MEFDEDKEVQHAEVTLRVALPFPKANDDEEHRKKAILRTLRLSEMKDGLELSPGMSANNVTLNEIETMEEAAMRQMGQAEAAHEAELDRRRERYFDNRGHF